jgi:trans-aconitate methyltransferase
LSRRSNSESVTDRVRRRYDAFPYPARDSGPIPVVRLRRYHLESLHYACYRRHRSYAGARILELGCGTGQSTRIWAEANPDVEITAIDLSPESVTQARSAVREYGNVTVEVADLLSYAPPEPFDFVIAEGVLHHLPDPRVGFARLRSFLAEEGMAAILVYSELGRWEVGILQHVLRLLTSGTDELADSLETARSLVREIRPDSRLWGFRARYGSALEHDEEVVDLLLHPQEHQVGVRGLFRWLEAGPLRHLLFHDEASWRIENVLESAHLLELAEGLDRETQYALCDLLLADRNHYDFLADARAPGERLPNEIWSKPGELTDDARPVLPPFTVFQETRVGRSSDPDHRQEQVSFYAIGEGEQSLGLESRACRMLELADGTRSVKRIVSELASDSAEEAERAKAFLGYAERAGLLWIT